MIFLMDMPPPVHGMSSINLSIYQRAVRKRRDIKLVNTVPSRFSKFFNTPLWGSLKIAHSLKVVFTLLFLFLFCRQRSIYRPINGGSGKVFDLFYLGLARVFGAKITIHHHSFNYINQKSFLFSLVNKLTHGVAQHVVLSQGMGEQLGKIYGIPMSDFIVLSNAAFFESSAETQQYQSAARDVSKLTIGHLANLCEDKGIDVFAELCRELSKRQLDFVARIAGPFVDEKAKSIVTSLCEELDCVEYLGPLYNQHKIDFFKSLDVFVFPSKYKNEAEPLVIYEAAEHGALVIGSTLGCMQEVIESLDGFAIPMHQSWVIQVADIIAGFELMNNRMKLTSDRIAAFHELSKKSKQSLEHFLGELSRATT